ncbi:hypothetical protein BJX99DRAFT_236173 [Aspergillus californicus]
MWFPLRGISWGSERVLIQRALSKGFVKRVHVGERGFIIAIVLSGRLERSNVPTTTKSVLIITGDA